MNTTSEKTYSYTVLAYHKDTGKRLPTFQIEATSREEAAKMAKEQHGERFFIRDSNVYAVRENGRLVLKFGDDFASFQNARLELSDDQWRKIQDAISMNLTPDHSGFENVD